MLRNKRKEEERLLFGQRRNSPGEEEKINCIVENKNKIIPAILILYMEIKRGSESKTLQELDKDRKWCILPFD